MRKLKLQVQISIDGFIGGPKGEMDWLKYPWTPDIEKFVTDLTEPVDTIILGRNLAEGFIPHWAAVAADAGSPEQSAGHKFSDTPKVVFTKTLQESKWKNTVLAKGDIVTEVTKLKKEKGADIISYGGAQFVSALIKHQLIDEYYLFVNPSAIGKGMAIFSELTATQNLQLIKATPFDCGIVVLHYEQSKN